jgi:hypothetical protein
MPFDKLLDGWVYSLGGVLGGHAVKHLFAAMAMFWLFWFMLRPRRPRAAAARRISPEDPERRARLG